MKKKTVTLVLAGIVVVAALGAGLYFGTDIFTAELPGETVVETENPLALDGDTEDRGVSNGETMPNSNIVLDDNVEGLEDIQVELADRANTEKANGTGEYAPIETSYDLGYEQQVAEENGTAMPTETVDMYATTKCNIRETPSTSAPVVSKLEKGDAVVVSKVGEWNEVVLEDGTTGYVRGDLLADGKPAESAPVATTEPAGESAPSADTGVTAPVEQADPTEGKSEATDAASSAAALDAWAASIGATSGEDTTGVTGIVHVDPNAAENSGVDLSGVTLH